ncbi:hypothetical protein MXB_3606 [Myxobolus squamalis]|nr:hypothetical protein MXB_3606 [Myxobolus squamalis]
MNHSNDFPDEKKLDKNEKINDSEQNISRKFYTLNKQFMIYLKYCYDANKNADFTPVLNDYIDPRDIKYYSFILADTIPSSLTLKKDAVISENIVLTNSLAQNVPPVQSPDIPSSEKKSW